MTGRRGDRETGRKESYPPVAPSPWLPVPSLFPSLADDRGDGLRVGGRDALIPAQGVAEVLRGRLAQFRVERGGAVDFEERALGRLVVDAEEAVEAEAARLGVFGLREDFGGGACGGNRGTRARVGDVAKGAAHVFDVPDHFDHRGCPRDLTQEALVILKPPLGVERAPHLFRRASLAVLVEAEADDAGSAQEGARGLAVRERDRLFAPVALDARRQTVGPL